MSRGGLFPRRIVLWLFFAWCLTAAQSTFGEVRYGTASWDAERYGNHRVVVRVAEKAEAVWVHILWRRRDLEPEKKKRHLRRCDDRRQDKKRLPRGRQP